MEIKAFQELNLIGKTPAIAKIGGFRPDPAVHSWFAGHFSSILIKAGRQIKMEP